jgi:hypothetical protein
VYIPVPARRPPPTDAHSLRFLKEVYPAQERRYFKRLSDGRRRLFQQRNQAVCDAFQVEFMRHPAAILFPSKALGRIL